ncbi:MAG TPA: ChaN family lipoprotein [Thermoanaerobaculia bacterium]|nr:ChaN family lipoprotein [Thermoanaerobaculia bacterium]
MKTRALLLLSLLFVPGLVAQERTLHLAIGDPARKDKEARVVLDTITDTRTGDALTPAALAKRLGNVRLLLVGESHTDMEFHRAQLRVLEELARTGRPVLLGLEMYPYTEQKHLDQWVDGLLTEEGFLRLSRWYENWGYHWGYYRDIFLFARDRKVRMFAVNAPREVVNAVRTKGFGSLTPEEAANIPRQIDTSSPDHRTLFKSFFTTEDAIHSGMTEEQWDSMIAAQATWDAAMAHNALKVLRERGGPDALMVVLVGSGHVAYGVGIERQAVAQGFDGRIASVIPVNVADLEGRSVQAVQASYADFVWGLPAQAAPVFPSLGLSTKAGKDVKELQVIFVSEETPAARSGVQAGDVVLALDGAPVPDKETLNRLVAARRWGDEVVLTVRRGGERKEIVIALRR